MFSIPFILAAWLTVTPFPQQTDSTSVVLVEFSREMDETQLLIAENYSLASISSGSAFSVDSVFVVLEIDGIDVPYFTLVALVTQRLKPKEEYSLVTFNLVNSVGLPLSDSSAWFYFNGFVPNLFSTPSPGFYASGF